MLKIQISNIKYTFAESLTSKFRKGVLIRYLCKKKVVGELFEKGRKKGFGFGCGFCEIILPGG